MSDATIRLTIDGTPVEVAPGTTLFDAARLCGVDIPALCHDPRLPPVGVCRLCVVDTGARTFPAACVRACESGMEVRTHTEELLHHRRTLLQLLLADYPEDALREATGGNDELLEQARAHGITAVPFPARPAAEEPPRDLSSPVIAVDHRACILCDRCIRGCNALQHNDVITRTGKGRGARIAFDLDAPMGESTCVSCGECLAVCPTGALVDASLRNALDANDEVSS